MAFFYGPPRDKINEPQQGLKLDFSRDEDPLTIVRVVNLSGGKKFDYVKLAKLYWLEEIGPTEIAKRMGKSVNSIYWELKKIKYGKISTQDFDDSLNKKITQSIQKKGTR